MVILYKRAFGEAHVRTLLKERSLMSMSTERTRRANRRDECRTAAVTPISYSYSYVDELELKCLSARGISVNMSESGMCLYTNNQLQDGLDLKLYSQNLFESPKAAVVQWCDKINEELYKVGVTLH